MVGCKNNRLPLSCAICRVVDSGSLFQIVCLKYFTLPWAAWRDAAGQATNQLLIAIIDRPLYQYRCAAHMVRMSIANANAMLSRNFTPFKMFAIAK